MPARPALVTTDVLDPDAPADHGAPSPVSVTAPLAAGGDQDGPAPRISVITPCIGRVAEFERLYESLRRETAAGGPSVEWIVVDQDPEQRLLAVLERDPPPFPWCYVQCADPPVSVKRNVGLRMARGELVHWMDDDAWYSGTTLRDVDEYFRTHDVAAVSGMLRRSDGKPAMLRWARRPTSVGRYNYHRTAIGPGVFYRRDVTERIGFFDEQRGPGASGPAGAAEDTDYTLRAAAVGPVHYRPEIVVHHEDAGPIPGQRFRDKMLRYGWAEGERWRTERYPFWFRWWICGRRVARLASRVVTLKWSAIPAEAAWLRGCVLGFHNRLPR